MLLEALWSALVDFMTALLAVYVALTLAVVGYHYVLGPILARLRARQAPSLTEDLEAYEEARVSCWDSLPPRWQSDAHIELPQRERIGLRGPEIEHVAERVVQTRRAA